MKAKDKSILQQIQERYPGTDPDIDIDWEIGEIFFKAGEKQGRKEVVEWVNEHTYGGLSHMHSPEWQAKLKEWGLQEMPK